MHRLPLSTRSLAAGSFAGLAVFPLTVVALNLVQHGRYHPIRQAMSELALGRDGWLMTIAFCAMGIGTLLLALLLRRTARALVAPLLLTLAGLLDFVSASFHTDPGNVTSTMHGRIHNSAGIATFALFVVAIFASARSFRREPAWQRFAPLTLVWAVCAVGTFFLIPALGNAHFGLAQRIFVATWLSWSIAAATYARRLSGPDDEPVARSSFEQRPARA
jgi:lysylphosphatidylglycerol synthetase-like protein (DUF2156 family)